MLFSHHFTFLSDIANAMRHSDAGEETQVQVCVRARPLLQNEASHYERQCIRVADGTSIVVGNDRAFGFDRVFASDVGGEAIFSAVGHPTMEAFLDGFNATILAYGQTGAGKTYTMNDLIKRCVHHLQNVAPHDCRLNLTVLEIYNEQVIDLLDPSRPRLQVREGCDGDVFAAGQMVAEVAAAAELLSYIETATSSRSTASTNTNATSSRSHCIATVTLTTTTDGGRVTSRLNFVDLAGSERLKKAHAAGSGSERVREGIHINGGLLALGNVIHALCDGKSHVPFRSSKLTRMLQSSLAGNSRTVMIACVSSSDQSMDETLNTLKYADRARRIRLRVSRNALMVDDASQSKLIMMLRGEVRNLQSTLLEHHIPLPQGSGPGDDDRTLYDPDSTRDFQKRVITLEEELAREKRFSRTLEEDLYRAEFCAMRELETVKELQRKLQDLERANKNGTAANGGPAEPRVAAEHPEPDDDSQQLSADVEHHLNERVSQIKELEDGQIAYQRTVDDYQRRLKTVLQDKLRLQRELESAELRLEETQMEAHKKEQHRASLKASFEARLRAAEVAAAEYRRRVKDAEAVIKSRTADEEQLAKLRREAAALTDQLHRQRNQSRHEHIKLGKLVVNQQTELTSLSRKVRELETQKSNLQQTPRRNVSTKAAPPESIPRARHEEAPRTATPPPYQPKGAERRGLEAAIASLMSLDQDLADAEKERESIRNALEVAQASSETARWRRALKGFQLRLEQVESEMRQCDAAASKDESTYRRHHHLLEEKRSIQKKMTQLDDLRPACDDAMDQLREVEERIDSLRAARTYRMKVVRSMQQESDSSPRRSPSPRQHDQHGLRDTVRAQQLLIEELNQRITDQALLLQQLLPVSKEASRTMLLRGEH
jgi:hypothetical protein